MLSQVLEALTKDDIPPGIAANKRFYKFIAPSLEGQGRNGTECGAFLCKYMRTYASLSKDQATSIEKHKGLFEMPMTQWVKWRLEILRTIIMCDGIVLPLLDQDAVGSKRKHKEQSSNTERKLRKRRKR